MITGRQLVLRGVGPMVRRLTRASARVVMYHRFGPANSPRWLGADVFEHQVRYVKRRFQAARLDTLAGQLGIGREPRPSTVALTVDDGYRDFLELAYPILRRHGVPATVFVVSRFADQAIWLWFDALRYLMHKAKAGRYTVPLDGRRVSVELGTSEQREASWHVVADAAVMAGDRGREEILRAVQESFGHPLPAVPTDDYRAMTWSELRSLDPELIEIGAHTCTHPILSQCSTEQVVTELTRSKARIEEELGRPVRSFCYPSGRPEDYDARVAAVVKQAGYDCGVVAHGSFVRAGSDVLTLERMGAPSDVASFRNLMNGTSHLYEQMMRRFQRAAVVV